MTLCRTKPAGDLSADPANVGSIARTLHLWIGKEATILVLAIAILTAQTRIAAAELGRLDNDHSRGCRGIQGKLRRLPRNRRQRPR